MSTGPNLAKSTAGQGNRFSTPPPETPPEAAPAAAGARAPDITCLTKPCTSSLRIRPLGPEPLASRVRSTPSSRAKRRTEGLACTLAKLDAAASAATGMDLTGGGGGALAGLGARGARVTALSVSGNCGLAAASVPLARKTRIKSPCET